MQWKASEMCFSISIRCLNKTKNTDFFSSFFFRICFSCFFYITYDNRQTHWVCVDNFGTIPIQFLFIKVFITREQQLSRNHMESKFKFTFRGKYSASKWLRSYHAWICFMSVIRSKYHKDNKDKYSTLGEIDDIYWSRENQICAFLWYIEKCMGYWE